MLDNLDKFRKYAGEVAVVKKLMAVVLPVFLVLSLMTAPLASAQTTEMWDMGEAYTHGGKSYIYESMVSGAEVTANISIDGDVQTYRVGDSVGDFKLKIITNTYVLLESEHPDEEEPEDDDENLPGSTQFRQKFDDGDMVVFTDSGGANGAMAYAFGLSEHPTFLFWSGGNIPSVAKTPPPVETTTIPVGRSYTPQMVPGLGDLVVTVESTDGTGVMVVFETDDSVNMMKTTIGPTDWTELVDKLVSEAIAKIPDAPIVPPVDTSGITFALWGFFFLGVFFVGMKWRHGWGQRW